MNLNHIIIIIDWFTFKSQYNIFIFLDFINFYRYFIKVYSCIILFFINLFHKSQYFLWINYIQEVFDILKKLFINILILKHFNLNLLIILYINFSEIIIFKIINQFHNNIFYFIIFWSRKYLFIKYNYDIHNQEIFIIIKFMKY